MFKVATYNIRFTLDRWNLRRPFCLKTIKDVDADIYGFQEVNIGGRLIGQNVDIAQQFEPRPYVEASASFLWYFYLGIFGARLGRALNAALFFLFDLAALCATLIETVFGSYTETIFYDKRLQPLFLLLGAPWTFGIAMVATKGHVMSPQQILRLGHYRVVQRSLIALHGKVVLVANTHLSSDPEGSDEIRRRQAEAIVAWMDGARHIPYHIIMGDFNTRPNEPAYHVLRNAGFVSAYATVHIDQEPRCTYPTGLRGPASPAVIEEAKCLDYIWIRGAIEVVRAGLFGDEMCPGGDPELYPSDHAGVEATLKFL